MTGDLTQELQFDIEPLDPTKHDRAAFSCGSTNIDNFLKQTAKKQQKDGFTRVWVAVPTGGTKILGYYAMNTHAIEIEDLPESYKKRLRHDHVPAAYISMLGVDQTCQGRGLGTTLLMNAFKKILVIAKTVGIHAVVLDVLDDKDDKAISKRIKFYKSFGFTPFSDHPLRMYITVKTIEQAFTASR